MTHVFVVMNNGEAVLPTFTLPVQLGTTVNVLQQSVALVGTHTASEVRRMPIYGS